MELVASGVEEANWTVVRYHTVVEEKENKEIFLRGF